MPTKKMHDEESYELDNVYNEDDRFYTQEIPQSGTINRRKNLEIRLICTNFVPYDRRMAE